jgi:hypothetical protein
MENERQVLVVGIASSIAQTILRAPHAFEVFEQMSRKTDIGLMVAIARASLLTANTLIDGWDSCKEKEGTYPNTPIGYL